MMNQLAHNMMPSNAPRKTVAIDESVHTETTVDSSISTTSSFVGTTTATSTTSITSSTKKSIRFGSLSIHSYYIELGGTGIPNCGPSITLGRELKSSVTVKVEDYENTKQETKTRVGTELYVLKKRRIGALIASGYSNGQIRACTIACHAIRKQRAKTVKKVERAEQSKVYDQFHKFAQSVEDSLQQANRRFRVMRRKPKKRTSLQLP